MLTSIVLAVAAIGGLFAIVTILGQPSPNIENAKTDQADSEKSNTDKGGPDALDKVLAKDSPPKKKELPPVDETLEFFEKRKAELAWRKINGYLVKLDIRTPIRTRTITGLIVDSRGWVVTSLSALQDAGEVTVTLAGKNLNDSPPFRELVDLSRGILATDPEHDLALISINRAQVINLADIVIDEKNLVVASTRLLIARTPPPRHRQWYAECRVDDRRPLKQLPDSVQRKIGESDSETRWLVCTPRLPTDFAPELAGSPLINDQGEVLALHTGMTTDSSSLAVPGIVIRNLVDSVPTGSPQLQPFARSADLIQTAAGNSNGDSTDTDNPADPMLEAKRRRAEQFETSLENLMNAFDICRKTDWSAELDTEYAAMQDLVKHFSEIEEWLVRNRVTADELKPYQEKRNTAWGEIEESIKHDLIKDEFMTGKGNEFFFKQTNSGNPWFMISATVTKNQISSRKVDGQETVEFEIVGGKKLVLAAARPGASNFRLGKTYMLLGRLNDRQSIKDVKLIDVHIHFAY